MDKTQGGERFSQDFGVHMNLTSRHSTLKVKFLITILSV